jgi:hypothetical protein
MKSLHVICQYFETEGSGSLKTTLAAIISIMKKCHGVRGFAPIFNILYFISIAFYTLYFLKFIKNITVRIILF